MANRKNFGSLYLSDIEIFGYKSIESLKVDFDKNLNILIGKNGVGKSNLLEVIYLSLYPISTPRINNFKQLDISLKSLDNDDVFEVKFERSILESNFIGTEIKERTRISKQIYFNNEEVFPKNSKNIRRSIDRNILRPISAIFSSLEYRYPRLKMLKYHIPEKINFIDNSGTINIDNEGFGWGYTPSLEFITNILHKAENIWFTNKTQDIDLDFIKKNFVINEEIIYALQKYTPIQDIRFNPNINIYQDPKGIIIDNIKIDFFINNNWYPWSHLSDGTRRLFYLVTEIVSSDNGIILIEEPELGVHPHQFHLLMHFIKEQSENKQIILSTHSPQALDHLDTNELNKILIATYDFERGTQLRRLNSGEKEKAVEYMDEVGYLSDYWLHSDLEE